MAERTALKNRSHEKSSSRIVARIQTRQLRHLERDITTIEEEMERAVKEGEAFNRDFVLPTSIDGVGPITALTP